MKSIKLDLSKEEVDHLLFCMFKVSDHAAVKKNQMFHSDLFDKLEWTRFVLDNSPAREEG